MGAVAALLQSLQDKEEKGGYISPRSLGRGMLPSVKRVEEECEAILLAQYT